nr:integrase, catalytic region, zinc finger, CCHC-type, peptidase aspartic, catalytic [Tanacetum cinerariifolium]
MGVSTESHKSIPILKEGQIVDLKNKDNVSDSCAQSVEIDHLKQTLSEHLKEKESLMQTVTLLKNNFKKVESKNIDREIALEERIKHLDNIVFKRVQSAQPNSVNSPKPTHSSRPTKVEVSKELPKVSMVNTSLKKLKHHLASFDVVVKERTTVIAITEGSWGFEHTKEDKIKKELEEIEAINIELDHRVTKLIAENEHLKQTYKKKLFVVDDVVTSHPIDPEMLKVDVAPLASKFWNNKITYSGYLRHTQEETTTLREIVEQAKSLNPLNNSLDYACNKLMAMTPMNKTKRVRFTEPVTSSGNTNIKTTSSSNVVSNKPMLSSTGVNLSTSTSGSQPSGNTKKDKLNVNSDLKCVTCNGCPFSDNHDSFVLNFINNVNARVKSKSVKKTLRETFGNQQESCLQIFDIYGDLLFTNFVEKFLGTVKFGNDRLAKIMGYGDYQIGNVTISRVYFRDRPGHNLFFVGQFCDSDLEVAFHQHTCFIRNLEGVNLLTGSQGNNLHTLTLGDMMALGHTLYEMTPTTISSRLMPNPNSSTPFIPSSRTDCDMLFQPLFDELLTPPPSVDHPAPKVIAPIAKVVALDPAASTGSPSSTTVDQDAPLPNNS